MIEVAARQLLACGIWFAAYREAIGDPLPIMTGLYRGVGSIGIATDSLTHTASHLLLHPNIASQQSFEVHVEEALGRSDCRTSKRCLA